MLSSVLHSDIAIEVSVKIIRAFVNMRHFINNNLINYKNIHDMLISHDNKINYIGNKVTSIILIEDDLFKYDLLNRIKKFI